MRTTEGGLTLTRAKGLSTLAIRPRSVIEKSSSRAVPKKRRATGKAFAMTGKGYLPVDAGIALHVYIEVI